MVNMSGVISTTKKKLKHYLRNFTTPPLTFYG